VSLFTDKGVVLRTYRLGESDRIIVLLTEAHGKVRAVAKGVRRTTSKFGGRLEPLCYVSVLLWQGRGDLDIVNQVEVIDHFKALHDDLSRLSMGLSMLEVVDQLAQERHADPRLLTMLVGALRTLADPAIDPTLVPAAFFLKALVLDGAAPVLDRCASCGRSESEVDLVAFDLTEGGTLCRECRRGRPMSQETLALMRRVLGGELASMLAGPPGPGADGLTGLAIEAMESHLDRRLRSVHTGI
jgi:DNA repair protein RecO (recombination protein O)